MLESPAPLTSAALADPCRNENTMNTITNTNTFDTLATADEAIAAYVEFDIDEETDDTLAARYVVQCVHPDGVEFCREYHLRDDAFEYCGGLNRALDSLSAQFVSYYVTDVKTGQAGYA